VLTFGKRAKNARSTSLPSLWQHYLVAMATSLDKLENKVDPSSARKALSYGENIAKISPVYPEIFAKIRQFFGRVVPDVHKYALLSLELPGKSSPNFLTM